MTTRYASYASKVPPQYQQEFLKVPDSVISILIGSKLNSYAAEGLSPYPGQVINEVLYQVSRNPTQAGEQAYRIAVDNLAENRTTFYGSDMQALLKDSASYLSQKGYDYSKLTGIANEEVKQLVSSQQDKGLFGDILSGLGMSSLAPIIPIAAAYFLPGVGEAIAASLNVSSALGTALASVGLQTAQGVDLNTAIKNAVINVGVQAGAENVAADLNKALQDPKITNAVTSVGASIAKTAAQGGSAADIAKAATGALVGSGVSGATDSKVAGTIAGGLASGGNATTIATGVAGALGNATTNNASTTTTTSGTTPDQTTLETLAKNAGFPDYATYQQYQGNYENFFKDVFAGKFLPPEFGGQVGGAVAGAGGVTPGGGAGVTIPAWLKLQPGETTVGSVLTDKKYGFQTVQIFRPDLNDPSKNISYQANYDPVTKEVMYQWATYNDPNDPTKGTTTFASKTPPGVEEKTPTTGVSGTETGTTGGVDTGNVAGNLVTITTTQGNGIPDKNTQVFGGNVTIPTGNVGVGGVTGGEVGNVATGNVTITGGGVATNNAISNVTTTGGAAGTGNVVSNVGNVTITGGEARTTNNANVSTGNVIIGGIDTGISGNVGFGGGNVVTVTGGTGAGMGNVTVGGTETGNVTTGNVTVGAGEEKTGNVTSNVTTDTTKYKPELFIYGGVAPRITSSNVLAQVLGVEPYTSLPTTGLTTYRGAGEIESPETGGKRQNVWNEASLRLKDALGL